MGAPRVFGARSPWIGFLAAPESQKHEGEGCGADRAEEHERDEPCSRRDPADAPDGLGAALLLGDQRIWLRAVADGVPLRALLCDGEQAGLSPTQNRELHGSLSGQVECRDLFGVVLVAHALHLFGGGELALERGQAQVQQGLVRILLQFVKEGGESLKRGDRRGRRRHLKRPSQQCQRVGLLVEAARVRGRTLIPEERGCAARGRAVGRALRRARRVNQGLGEKGRSQTAVRLHDCYLAGWQKRSGIVAVKQSD